MSEPVGITVLHVDDEPDFADVSAEMVEREDEGISVQTVTSADTALERIEDGETDCIVSDYDMPGRNGIEFLETVRQSHPDLPFILFTGKGSEEVASDAFSAGATDYLRKSSGSEQYELLANRIRNAVEQHRSKQRAAHLDRIRTLVRRVNQALVRADDRSVVETRVCEIFSESDPYQFAWIGEVDPETERLEPRAFAGTGADYLDAITVRTDADAPEKGPGWVAVNQGRVGVTQDVTADPAFDQWRELANERGFRSVAAVPLEHEERRYGVLVVYASDPGAFDDNERKILEELGDDIAYAFHSLDVRDRLRTERDRRQALFENAPVPVIASETDDAGVIRITDVNSAFQERFGYDPEEVVGRDPADVIVPEGGMERHQSFRERATSGEPVVTEVERVTVDGPRTFLLHVIPAGVEEDSVDTMYAWYTDIAEREAHAQAIEGLYSTTRTFIDAESEASIVETAVEAARDVLGFEASSVHLYDGEREALEPVAWTDRVEALVGAPPAFTAGDSIAWEVFETGEPGIYDDVSVVPERKNPDTEIRGQFILPLDDHGVFLIGSESPQAFDETDISLAQMLATHLKTALERVEREAELARKRSLLESEQEAMIDGILVVDEDGRIVSFNDRFVEMWGLEDVVAEGEPHDDALEHALDRMAEPDAYIEDVKHLYDNPRERSRDEIELADGRVFDRYTTPVTGSDGTYYGRLWTFRDITDRKRRERELQRYEAYLEESNDIITVLDENGIIQYQSPSATRIIGYEDGALVGENGFDFIHPDDVDEVWETFTDLLSNPGQTVTAECRFRTADGSWKYLEIRGTNHLDHPDIDGIVTNNRDISDRKRREKELERQNKRLEEFASVVSHDLRNPLNVAQGRLELAGEECDSDDLARARDALDRSQGLIDDLLRLAREGKRVSETESVDLAEIGRTCWQNVETGTASLVTAGTRSIEADASRLKQLLENLIRNSVDHGGSDVTVTLGVLEDGFYVADDGPGIPPDDRSSVFDVGYSTTEEGTGFGLSIVADIADAHGWQIDLTESEDGGARFEITGVDAAER